MSDTVVDPPQTTAVPVDAIIERYIQLRDKKAQLKAEFTKETESIDAALERVETYLLKLMNSMGVNSLNSKLGTAYTQLRTSAGVEDWDQVLPWIQENNEWAMLEKRVNKTFVEAYRTEHNDLPPGIKWREDRTVNIRRS